jgi:hypothetical protein
MQMPEIEFDIRKYEESVWWMVLAVVLIVALFGLAQLGKGVTPLDPSGSPRVMNWSDWKLLQAERLHMQEINVLRDDATQLVAIMQQRRPYPVAAQLLTNTVNGHVKDGSDPSLDTARQALAAAAVNVRDYAAGTLDRNTAIQSVQIILALLK